jgi:hypothetical protein
VQAFETQFHPVPVIDTSVSPEGTVSVTVTVPVVAEAAAEFATVTVYVALICPCVKLPVCDFVTDRDEPDASCVTVKIWPPTLIVDVRELPVPFTPAL